MKNYFNIDMETKNAHSLDEWCSIVKKHYLQHGGDVLYYVSVPCRDWLFNLDNAVSLPCAGEYIETANGDLAMVFDNTSNTIALQNSFWDQKEEMWHTEPVKYVVFDLEDYITKKILTNPKRVRKLKNYEGEAFINKILNYTVAEMRLLKRKKVDSSTIIEAVATQLQ